MTCGTPRSAFRYNLAQLLIEDLGQRSQNSYYLFVSKCLPWEDFDAYPSGTTSSDAVPPINPDTVDADARTWREILLLRRLTADNVSFVLPRIDWVSGLVWTPYRSSKDLHEVPVPNPDNRESEPFYVLVDDTRVYKCIDNNDGAVSTVKPQTRGTDIELTSDGYRWKFMYSIDELSRRYMTHDRIPVQHLKDFSLDITDERRLQWAIQGAAVDGGIEFIDVNPGASFGGVELDLGANTANSNEEGTSTIKLSSSSNSSDGYYTDYAIVIAAGTPGEGQIRRILAYNGSTKIATIDRPWTSPIVSGLSKYQILPYVEITGDGIGAEAIAECDENGSIVSIEIVNRGSGYSYATCQVYPSVEVETDRTTAEVVISPPGGHGSNPVKELGSKEIMILCELDPDQTISAETNEFRQFGIIRNPIIRGGDHDGEVAGSESEVMALVEVQSVSPIIFWESEPDPVTFPVGGKIVGVDSNSTGDVFRWVVEPPSALQTRGTLLLQNPVGSFVHPIVTAKQTITLDTPNRLTLVIGDLYVDGSDFTVGDTVYQGEIGGTFPGEQTATGVVESWTPSEVGTPGSILVLVDLSGDAWSTDGSEYINQDTVAYRAARADNQSVQILKMSTLYASGNDFFPGQLVYQGAEEGPFPGPEQTAFAYVQAWIPAEVGAAGSVLVVRSVTPNSDTAFSTDESEWVAPGGDPPEFAYQVESVLVSEDFTFEEGNTAVHSAAEGITRIIIEDPYLEGDDFVIGDTIEQGDPDIASGEVVSWVPAPVGESGSILDVLATSGVFQDNQDELIYAPAAAFSYELRKVTEVLDFYAQGIVSEWTPSAPGTPGSTLVLDRVFGVPIAVGLESKIIRNVNNTIRYTPTSVSFSTESAGEEVIYLDSDYESVKPHYATVDAVEYIYVDSELANSQTPIQTLDEIRSSSFDPPSYYSMYHAILVQWDGVTLLDEGSFVPDDSIIGEQSGASGVILDWNPTRTGPDAYHVGILRVISVIGEFETVDSLAEPTIIGEKISVRSAVDGSVTTTDIRIVEIEEPELYHNRGDIVFAKNTKPIQRDPEQREEFKVLFGF